MIKNVKSKSIPSESHAFFTKKAVDSKKNPLLFDFSFSELQNIKITTSNHQLAAKSLGLYEQSIYFVNQVHSSKVILIDSLSAQKMQTGDGMVTKLQGLGLAILTADCAPILFFDPVSQIIGAAHAGWRGALNGIIENTINLMLEIGANKNNIIASIGPCISQENYEVDLIFKTEIIKNHFTHEKLFFQKPNDKYLFNLSAYIEARLHNYGIKEFSSLGICTYEKQNNFHSFRRAQHTGVANHQRNLSIIKL